MTSFTLPGGLLVHAFSLLLGLGAGLGLAWAAGRAKPRRVSGLLDAGLASLLGALLGGRLVYVALNWPYFAAHLGEIPQVQLGGLAWPGAALGAALALLLLAPLTHVPFGEMLDALIPLGTVMAVCAWLACWLDGIAYGPALNAWWALPARDEWGTLAPRLPLQLLCAALTLGLAWLVDRPRGRARRELLRRLDSFFPERPAVLWVSGFSLILLGFSLLRADPSPAWLGLRLDAWAALAMVVISFAFLTRSIRTEGAEQRL